MTLRSMPADHMGAVVDADKSSPMPRRHRLSLYLFAPVFIAIGLLAAGCSSGNPPSATSSANSLISQGLSAESHGQNQQAIRDFSAAVAKNPSTPIAYYDLGVIYQQQLNQPIQAANEFNKALLANPNYKPALYDLAILETSTNPTQAISLYQQLLKLNPNDPNVLFNLGLLLYAHNAVAQGQADLNKAISIDPSLKSRVPAGVNL
jgi:tetratricopeptide (TPR) repeat protein